MTTTMLTLSIENGERGMKASLWLVTNSVPDIVPGWSSDVVTYSTRYALGAWPTSTSPNDDIRKLMDFEF